MQQNGIAGLIAASVPHGWRRHGDAVFGELSLTIEALRRKLRQPASSAVMIWIMGSRAGGKIHGIARAFHNSEKCAGYNSPHRAASGLARSELAHSLHQTNTACSACDQK
jgi:hypothetical protein